MANNDIHTERINDIRADLRDHIAGCPRVDSVTNNLEKHIVECETRHEKLHNLVQGVIKCQEEAELVKKTVADTRKFHLWLASTVGGGVLGALYLGGQFIMSNLDAIKTFWNSISLPK